MRGARRLPTRAIIAFIAVVASISAASGACTNYQRADGEECIKNVDCLSGFCLAQVCGQPNPTLSGSTYEEAGTISIDAGSAPDTSTGSIDSAPAPDSSSGGTDASAAPEDSGGGEDASLNDSSSDDAPAFGVLDPDLRDLMSPRRPLFA
jgi:hypothetical protein